MSLVRFARVAAIACSFGATLLGSSFALGDDWPTFRGAKRTAVATDSNLLKSWPEGGPQLVWEATGAGRGYSSLAVAGDKVFTLGDALSTKSDEEEYLTAFDRKSGKQLWATRIGSSWKEMKNDDWNSSRSTPTVDDGMVYVVTPKGVLVACNTVDGKEAWRKNLVDDFGGKKDDQWGYSESVLVDGDKVVCTPGGENATMVALNKKTGELIWKAVRPGDRGAGHASIVISEMAGPASTFKQQVGGARGFSKGWKAALVVSN